jgi:hypothetical protein
MFRYYQETPTAKWAYVVDTEKAIQDLINRQIPMMSILSVKEPIDDEEEDEKYEASYKGDFYVDIDNADISLSIEAAQEFDDKLRKLSVTGYSVFLSGKKGFHFIVPMTVFSAARPTKHLPLIYKEMAFELYVEGLDMSVYNQARPRLLRTPNVKRIDNSKYKVAISPDDLEKLTPETYAELTSEPRPLYALGEVKRSIKMETLYEACKARVSKKLRAAKDVEYVPSEELAKTIGANGELPGCIRLLVEKGDTKEGANFNQATMQFAAYVTRAGVKDWQTYAKQMAHNVRSSSYNSESKRLQAIKKMVNYVNGSKSFGFSKGALFAVIDPCRDCDICNGTVEDGEIVPENHEEPSEIIETPHGYHIGIGKTRRKLTTFTLDVISKFTEKSDEEYGETRIGTNAMIKVNGHKRSKVAIPENAWISQREFKETFKGKEGYAFYGTDMDLQKLQNKLFSDTSNIPEICYVHSVGMHRHKVGGRTIFVYAEPNFSVSSIREKNTHEVWGHIPAAPCIKDAAYPEPTEDLKSFINHMLDCNDPEVVSTLVGWMALCHIKVQLTMRNNQFPLLNLWGNAGSGKSALSAMFAALHGVDYELEHSPISLQGTTPWAVAQYCTTSESTPRLIEEFNVGEIPISKYDQFSGLLKAAFNMQTFAKGGIERSKLAGINVSGAKVMEAKISAPLCVMSEQAPERPALRQRMIQVNINRKGRDTVQREAAFYYLMEHKQQFYSLARAMVWESLTTHPEDVSAMMDSYRSRIPREIDARPRYAYQALLTGVEFFGRTLTAIGMDKSFVEEKVEFMQSALLKHLSGTLQEVRKEKLTTEVLLVLHEMCLMADAGRSVPPGQWSLIQGKEYFRSDEHLYLDARVAHSKYLRWARSGGIKVILTSYTQFEILLKQEEFYHGEGLEPDLADGKLMITRLDCQLLRDRGVPVDMFEGDY